jgi:hypothetical protein
MKRLLILLVIALMTISIIACSSTNNPNSGTSTKVAESSTPPKSTVPSGTPTPTDTSKAPVTPTPTNTSKAVETPAPADASKVVETPAPAPVEAPAASPKAEPAPTPAPAPAPVEAPKATEAPAEKPKAEPAPAPVPAPAEAPKAEEAPAEKPKVEPAPVPVPAPAPAPQPEEISAKGKKLLLVGRERAPEDDVVADRLKGLGFKVSMMIDRELTADATKGYDLIYISQTLNSKIVKDGIMKNVAIPTVYAKNHGMFYLGLSSIEENANILNVKSIDIVDSNHMAAGGLSGTVNVYKETGPKIGISYGLPGSEAKVIATASGDKGKAAIYYYDKGTKADNGNEVKARVSFFYYFNGGMDNITDAGWKLLDSLVLWTLQNG